MFDFKKIKSGFRVRSTDRDVKTDEARAKLIFQAVEKVAKEAEEESVGLRRRLDDILSRASVTIGNSTDEYLTRDALSKKPQSNFDSDIRYVENRLSNLSQNIEYYRSLKTLVASAIGSKIEHAETTEQ